jgi:hypothetical protein
VEQEAEDKLANRKSPTSCRSRRFVSSGSLTLAPMADTGGDSFWASHTLCQSVCVCVCVFADVCVCVFRRVCVWRRRVRVGRWVAKGCVEVVFPGSTLVRASPRSQPKKQSITCRHYLISGCVSPPRPNSASSQGTRTDPRAVFSLRLLGRLLTISDVVFLHYAVFTIDGTCFPLLLLLHALGAPVVVLRRRLLWMV